MYLFKVAVLYCVILFWWTKKKLKNEKVYEVMIFDMWKYVYSESVFNTL